MCTLGRGRRVIPHWSQRGSKSVSAIGDAQLPPGTPAHPAYFRYFLFPFVPSDAAPAQNTAEDVGGFAEWQRRSDERGNCGDRGGHRRRRYPRIARETGQREDPDHAKLGFELGLDRRKKVAITN